MVTDTPDPRIEIRCGATMYSGLTCALAPDHDGEHVDRIGLRDPSWVSER